MQKKIVISKCHKHKYVSRATGTLLKLTIQQNSFKYLIVQKTKTVALSEE